MTTTQVSSVKETSALISLNKKNMLKTRQTEIKDGCRQSEKHGADAVAPHLSVRMLRASRSARLVHKQSPSRECMRGRLLQRDASRCFRWYWARAFSPFVVNLINRALEGRVMRNLRKEGGVGGTARRKREGETFVYPQGPSG